MSTGGCSTVFFFQWRVSSAMLFRVGLSMLLAATLSGCAGLVGKPQTPEQIVAERAQARWDALVAGDWQTAYSFATPAYRDLVDVEGFRRRHGGQASWLGADVKEVTCQDDVCEPTITLKFRSLLPPYTDDLHTDYTERWVLEGSDWWIFLKP